jgi:type I restriction enzyme S subunit
MPNDWKTYKLGDLIKIKHGFAFKGEFFSDEKNDNVLLTPGNFNSYGGIKFNWDKQKFYKGEFPVDYILNEGDLIIALTDLTQSCSILGSTAIINDKDYNYLHNQRLGLVKDINPKVNANFLYYVFNNSTFRNHVIATKTGSTVSHTAPERIYNYEINIPEDIKEQQSIASILSAIDDKIENNLAINKTLEEMAMALYKHWFVDFGPFQGGEFVESELGMIPKGWEVKKITELIEVKDGTHDSPKRVDEGCFLITSKHMIGNIIDFSTAYKISQDDFTKINKRSLVEKGDILMTMIGTVGNFHFVNEEPNYVIKNIGLFKTSKLPKIQSYLYSYFKSKIGQEYIKAQMTGSTQQYVTLNTLRNFDIIVPNEETLNEFNQITNYYFETIMTRTKENQTLTQLRDSLLPQLISGAVRLKEFRG